ncbi:putative Histidine kinase [Syntrophobacter sp. SbD1]|nr:putative Histidine kinase [Syntrophobacter sp. SbD1]
MNQSISILHLEDDAADAELVEAILESAGLACRITRVQTCDEFREALRQSEYDTILGDYSLPAYDGMSALRLVQELDLDVPFIFVSGTMGENAAIEGLTKGATDYVLKKNLSRLAPAVNRALRDAENRRERKRAEEELLRAKEDWERTFDAVSDLISILDKDYRIVRMNKAMAQRLGVTPGKCVGLRCYESVHGSLVPPEFCPQTLTLKDGQEHVAEVHEERLGGDFLISTTPLRDEQGVFIGTVQVARDITERKRMEEELRKSRDEMELRVQERTAELNSYMAKLEQSNQALQDFASIAAHDLREPLRKVISFGDMLRQESGESLGQSGNDYLNRMLHATERMKSLLTGLLDYSRVATAAEPFKEVDLSDLIGEVLSDLEVRVVKTGGEVHVGSLPVISADPTQMRQLFQNLIGNALKFHKEGEKPLVTILGSTDEQWLRIVVEDNGIGFEEQYLEKIFAPFQRLHGKSSQYEGTGIGLAICKKIVERHGGSIRAESQPGQGSTFIIRLPVNQDRYEGV